MQTNRFLGCMYTRVGFIVLVMATLENSIGPIDLYEGAARSNIYPVHAAQLWPNHISFANVYNTQVPC